jgi:hypothetical protein
VLSIGVYRCVELAFVVVRDVDWMGHRRRLGVAIGSRSGGGAEVECQEGGKRGMWHLAGVVTRSFFFLFQMLRFYFCLFLHKFIKPKFIRENLPVEDCSQSNIEFVK